jgi:chemotaxis methyl-accepting protein methylase
MNDNTMLNDISTEIPAQVLSNPTLLYLYCRIEQILGIKSKFEPLKKLNDYLEENCGCSFLENSSLYENFLSSKEQIFNYSKFFSVNETYFFRESAHYKLLMELLPGYAKLNRPIQICSAASSIGCEAYSIAMLINHLVKNGLQVDFEIDAFDVSNDSIETAKKARFSGNSFRSDGADMKFLLDSYLEPDNGEFIVKQNIRDKVRFFPHNIMTDLDKRYDIIFFKNALIYFSSPNRLIILNNLSRALLPGGLFFLGASETSSVKHPLLCAQYSSNVFYFQKIEGNDANKDFELKREHTQPEKIHDFREKKTKPKLTNYTRSSIQNELPVNYPEIPDILKIEEGKENGEYILDMVSNGNTASLSGSALAAAVIYFLNNQDFDRAEKILSFLEKHNKGACTKFLRGELHFLLGNFEQAEQHYQEASVKDKYFWPAFYRISIICSGGNRTRYEYKIKKAIESIELSHNSGLSKESNYEFFLGGFSPDYFLRILEKNRHRGIK